MIVKVKTLTGKEISVELKESDLVYHIKELLEEKEGIPPSQQRLIFQGKQMYVKVYIIVNYISPVCFSKLY